jgi:DNA-binding transcriptional ArsR family regulator
MNAQDKSNDAVQPVELFTIDNIETLRLLTEPLRMRVMNAFADTPATTSMTVKQLSAKLDLRPTRLYYHVKLLEEHGLLRVASSRVVSGIIEKSYVLVARSITVDPALLKVSVAGREATAATVMALMQATASEIADSLETAAGQADAELRQMRIGKSGSHLSAEAHAEFLKRLNELVEEFDDKYGTPGDLPPNRALFVAYYPLPTGRSADSTGPVEGTDR